MPEGAFGEMEAGGEEYWISGFQNAVEFVGGGQRGLLKIGGPVCAGCEGSLVNHRRIWCPGAIGRGWKTGGS